MSDSFPCPAWRIGEMAWVIFCGFVHGQGGESGVPVRLYLGDIPPAEYQDPDTGAMLAPRALPRKPRYAPRFAREFLGVLELDEETLAELDGWTRRAYTKSRARILRARESFEREYGGQAVRLTKRQEVFMNRISDDYREELRAWGFEEAEIRALEGEPEKPSFFAGLETLSTKGKIFVFKEFHIRGRDFRPALLKAKAEAFEAGVAQERARYAEAGVGA